MKRRVVITGMGALTPIGNNVEDFWQNAKKGVCGIGEITRFNTENHKVKLAAEIKDFDVTTVIDKREVRKLARFTQLAICAAHEAVKMSGLDFEKENRLRCGVNVASGIGGLDVIEEEHYKGQDKGFDRVSPFFIPMAISNMASGMISIAHGLHGSSTCVVTACASGTNAIGDSMRQIRDGYTDIMICGGTEASITPLGIGGFTSMRALCESNNPARASIPFDKERSGFVMGEGAGVLVLEEYEHAKARGAKIYAELSGYAATCDASHMTAPLEDGRGAADCMRLAMEDAGLQVQDIDYINAHGTSTPLNDRCETAAVKNAFGEAAQKLCISSTKSMTGHLLGAAGAIEAVLCIKALQEGVIPPTINYSQPDDNCDLDIVPNKAREKQLNYAMSNSLGFGGHNATLIFGKVK